MTLTIKGRVNGPYMIDGAYTYTGANGDEQTTSGRRVHLCRCGGSANKPFCDGTRRKIDFRAPVAELTLVNE
jgi:CDGSH-type Zn-finger protein